MENCHLKTPIGTMKISGDAQGVSEIIFTNSSEISNQIPEVLQQCVTQIEEYFSLNRTVFTFKINQNGTSFQEKVWQELSDIPFGKTISYLDLAKKLGNQKVIRAAATANGKNKLLIVVPCHRVIGSDGSLTGYAGELWRKKWFLEHENPTKQESLF